MTLPEDTVTRQMFLKIDTAPHSQYHRQDTHKCTLDLQIRELSLDNLNDLPKAIINDRSRI